MYSKENDNVKYLMTCIDVFSKYAWVRVLKTKTGAEVARIFEDILKEGRVALKLQTDRGVETNTNTLGVKFGEQNMKTNCAHGVKATPNDFIFGILQEHTVCKQELI